MREELTPSHPSGEPDGSSDPSLPTPDARIDETDGIVRLESPSAGLRTSIRDVEDEYSLNEEESHSSDSDPQEEPSLDWKEELRNSFDHWLNTVEEIPESLEEDLQSGAATPDLYSFYAALTAMSSENRKANRKFAEALSQWQEGSARNQAAFEQVRSALAIMASERESQEKRLSRPHCLALVEILDRLRRLSKAFASGAPAKKWWGRDEEWRKIWATQGQAFDILIGHFESLLKKEGVTRIETAGKQLDPLLMMAVAAEPDSGRPHQTVVEEIAAGYYRDGELLRVAQVKVTTNINSV